MLARLRMEKQDASDGASNPMNLDISAHQRQLEDFVAAVREGRAPAVDGREALKAWRSSSGSTARPKPVRRWICPSWTNNGV